MISTLSSNWLKNRAKSTPNRIALDFKNKSYTFSELYEETKKIALSLNTMASDSKRFAILMNNSDLYVFIIHGLIYLNKQLVLINRRLKPEEIEYQLKSVEVDVLISDDKLLIKQLNHSCKTILGEELIQHTKSIEINEHNPEKIDPDDVFSFVFTSGTTGKPKIVPLTYANHFWSAVSSAFRLGVFPGDRWLVTMPLYHLGGLAIVFRSCLYGIKIDLLQKFDSELVIESVKDGITLISLVPTMLKRLLPKFHNIEHNLRIILVGGAALSTKITQKAIQLNLPISTTYGLTESASQFATALPDEVRDKPTSVGKPLLFNNVRIFDRDENGIGQIGIQGPTVMEGYYNESDNKNIFEDGYFLTGDIGFVDEEGDLFVLQRRQDLIISGGENIYPSEVENSLRELKNIDDAIVLGVQDKEWGQIPVAILIIIEPISSNEIVDYLQSKIANYKIPRTYYLIDQFPRTSSGKISRDELKQLIMKGELDEL